MLSQLFPKLRLAIFFALSLLATACVAQTTINVGPGQAYTTIQAGINAASNGDTVLVAPGTYNENIDFIGKAITVTSSGGAASTIIDGGDKSGLPTVTFASGETIASTISGFTIRGGGDSVASSPRNGGVYVNGASATIEKNTITANYCHNVDVVLGSAAILNNEVSGLLQSGEVSGPDQSYCSFGSVINIQANNELVNAMPVTVIANTLENNVTTTGIGLNGTAINLFGVLDVVIMNNTIRNNIAPEAGSAFTLGNAEGTVIVQNLIYGNVSECGGAIAFDSGYSEDGNPGLLIANNTMIDNVASSPLISYAGCADIAQLYPTPAGYGSSSPDALIVNNIISGSTSYPAVDCNRLGTPSLSDQPTFENDILYNSGGPFFGSYCVDVSDQDGNIASDPQFVNSSGSDYHLKSTSPAIDSGQNSVLQTFKSMTGLDWTTDFDGKPRVQNATGKGCIIDMGAYEYPGTDTNCGVSETLTSSLNPAFFAQSVTFTAQLSAADGTPTGTIQFLDGAYILSTQTVSSTGSASFTTSTLAVGNHTITANYQPTGSFSASTATLIETINGLATSTTLTCSPGTLNIGSVAQFTAAVTSASGTPTGSITFTDNGSTLATQGLVSGATSLAYTGSTAGTHSILATYVPTGAYAASSAACSETVNALPTTSVLTVAPATPPYGSSVTLTATVAPATLPGPSTPSGTVTFYNGGTALGTGTLSGGVATLSTTALPGGSDALSCIYGGSAIYATSNCTPVGVAVKAAPTVLTLISSNNPAPALSSITFTVRLTVNGESAGAGNAIRLSINGQIISLTTDATGTGIYTVGALSANSYAVVAGFAATNDLAASSASLTEVVTALPSMVSLTGVPNPGDVNQPVTLTANVSGQSFAVVTPGGQTPGAPFPSGSVIFYDGAASIGTATVSASDTATVTVSFSTVGVHNLTVVYGGDANYSGSTSSVFAETIQAGDFTIGVTPGGATLYTGQAASASVSVASLRGFNQALALTCVGLPANTTCTFSPASLPNGQGAARLTLQTTAPQQASSGSLSSSTLLLGALALLLPGWRRRRRLLAGLCLLLLAAGVGIAITGCGAPTPIGSGTPPGVYQVAITAATIGTGTPLSHAAVVTLTVKSLF